MATIHRTAFIATSPAKVWEKVAAVGRVHDMLPAIKSCRLDGDRRFCTMDGGAQLEEHVVSVDHQLMRVAYAVTGSPFPIDRHFASMRVLAEGTGTRFEWTTDVKPDATAEALAPLIDGMLAQLVEKISV
jgi:carbon monoxide dehydrogenase subunit G